MIWLKKLLGGRPMDEADGCTFTDIVSGRLVRYWRDCYGRYWMAHTRWGWFRVQVKI